MMRTTKLSVTITAILGITVLIGAIMMSCKTNKQTDTIQNSASEESSNKLSDGISFNADSAYHYIDKQVSFGPRVPGSEGWEKCGRWLYDKLSGFADHIILQESTQKTFDGKEIPCKNIIASINPDATNRVMVAAHWDTRPFSDQDPNQANHNRPILGADDGASGVGVILELARQWHIQKPNIGVDLILFDAEDYGDTNSEDSWCLGSTYWSNNPHVEDYSPQYGILLDMVGSKDATFYWERFSKDNAPMIVSNIWEKAAQLGFGKYFVQANGGYLTDDHIPIIKNRHIKMVDIVNYNPNNQKGFGDYWHTQGDNMNVISKKTLNAVGKVVKAVIDSEK
ncbi:M28 family peptidase [Falsiporphyromonas endometrii]|uniref:M28 family peptidase n=1 Tax=Falsiporphyromonas endometrii TaxID=1387297 RepID=A0ABV9K748_9PORP